MLRRGGPLVAEEVVWAFQFEEVKALDPSTAIP